MRLLYGIVLALGLAASVVQAQDLRAIERSPDSDYFGFDLRTERNLTIEQCETACLGDPGCRAFTYNTRAKWCFLKHDYNQLNGFPGAIAGKVVNRSGEPDIGAPPSLSFIASYMNDEAVRFRTGVTAMRAAPDQGLAAMIAAATDMQDAGDPRTAAMRWTSAISIAPDDSALWAGFARAALAVGALGQNDSWTWRQNANSAALVAYQQSRTTTARAESLDLLAKALAARSTWRPALEAYKASLALMPSPAVQAAFDDLYQRHGFRVIDNTIDSDNRSPRACVQFSEPLAKSGVDYSSFVTVSGIASPAVTAGERELCVEGLEHGKSYAITVRAGVPATIGETLRAPVALNIYVRDRQPSARFTGENFILPSTARRGIPLVTVNATSAKLSLYRIGDRALADSIVNSRFMGQVSGYGADRINEERGEKLWTGTVDVASTLNEEVTTSIPVDEILPERKPGVYVLLAEPADIELDNWTDKATQWFVVSDIGLATYAAEDGLSVFARSLATAKPMSGVALKLVARNNEILGEATTDAEGRAVFTAGLIRAEGGLAPAMVTADASGDFVFLDMTRAGFDLSDRGVEGRETPGAVDVYAWTERGIYRAGETVHLQALARDDRAKAIADLPLTVIFSRPDGVEHTRTVSDGAAAGGHAVELALPETAMRGGWTARLHTDPKASPLAEIRFLVEDFTPDRIEFDLSTDTPEVAVGEPATVNVDGRFLYGAPAAGLSLEGHVRVSTTRQWDGFAGYVFGLQDEEDDEYGQSTRTGLSDLPLTDDDGKASFEVVVDEVPSTTRLLSGQVFVLMREGGGRAVERRLPLTLRGEGPKIGIRPEFTDNTVREGSTAGFRVIAVSPEGERIDLAGMDWSLMRVERNYQWYRSGNSWSYEPVTFTTKVADGKLDATAGEEATLSLPVNWGRYRLEISAPNPTGPVTSVEFDAGWYVAATSTETPDGLEVALDKAAYAPGETARLQISPRFAGEVLVTVGADRLLATYTATVPEGGATIDIPVSAEWGAGAYVTAALYRPGEARESRMPMRAIGLKWLQVDPASRTIGVALEAPARMEPRRPLVVPLRLTNVPAGEKAYVTVAAVDVGILNLTSFVAPDPGKWYYGQRKMGIEMRDIYGRLIDGSLGAAGRIRTGGDGGIGMQGTPPTEKLVAFFSGIVEVDADGRAEVAFDIPQFNGTARVMAVAWSGNSVGRAETDVVIRDPVVVTASLPRFLSPGDRAELRLDIANTDGPAGEYTLALDAGGVTLDQPSRTVTLAAGERVAVTVPLVADDADRATIEIALSHASGVTVAQSLAVPVRPAVLPVASRRVVTLAANTGSLTIDGGLLGESLLRGATVSVGVSRSAALDVPALLMSLDRYPYGCAEQTTSRALPLLYLSELQSGAGMAEDPTLRERIEASVTRVLSYQSSSGSFGLWSPGSGDLWLDAYVTDFLTRARERGIAVPQKGFDQALRNLQNALAYDVNIADKGNEIAYALYVLARNRKAPVGDLRYYSDTQLGNFATPLARAHIAAGLALYGDTVRSEAAFQSAFRLAQDTSGLTLARSDYGSALRDGAAMLALAAESRPAPALIPSMVQLVAQERGRKTHTSTQEEAWMLLAARALSADANDIRLEVAGQPHQGNYAIRKTGQEVTDAPFTIANRTDQPLEAVLTTIAAPRDPLPAGGNGYAIDRTYYTLDGEPANVTEARQNDRYVVVLTVSEENAWPSRVLVSDLLPAGFQIDNPSIVGSAELSNFDWLGDTTAAHVEFRDDRFVAAFDRQPDDAREFAFAYVVRAVTPGEYAHPAASVEDMYRPEFSARTATGRMEVMAAQ